VKNITITEKVFVEVLETTAFLFAEPVDRHELENLGHENFFITYITFSGDVNGNLFILLSRETAHQLAVNMMGLDDDEEVDNSYIEDAAMELANMVCGKVVTANFGKEKLYDISIPLINSGKEDIFDQIYNDENTIYFSIDGRPALVNIKF
jgi:CheY-specific phosphatase CheX